MEYSIIDNSIVENYVYYILHKPNVYTTIIDLHTTKNI